jgi:uncharacterized delta-60 repeat protein
MRLPLVLLGLIVALVAAPAASAAPGDLDPSFGSGGLVKLLESHEESYAEAVAVQPDGKVVVAGHEEGNAVVVRLLPNGDPDPGFGIGGKATTVIPGGESGAFAVALQSDGKIVVAGTGKALGGINYDFFFARYNPDGSVDETFGGGDGVELVAVGTEDDDARALAIGPDGRIAATGTVDLPAFKNGLGVVVLEPDGTPDASFGGDGSLVKETEIGQGDDRGVAVALLAEGRVLLGDSCGAGRGNGFVLLRLLSNGNPDPGFGGGDGIVETPIPGEGLTEGMGRITDFALLPDGRIVASGYGADYGGEPPDYSSTVAAVMYTAEGELDSSFAGGGIFTRRIDDEGLATAVALGEKGRILLGGYYEQPASTMNADWVARLTPDGSLDSSFGSGGLVVRGDTAPFGETIEDIAVDPEDRLLTVGTAYGPNNTSWVSVARYLGDPRPPVAVPISAPANRPAHARMKAVPKKIPASKLKGFSGTAADPDGSGVQRVQIALVQKVRGGLKAKASSQGRIRCFALKNAKLRFKRVKSKGKQCPQVWLTAKGTSKWRFRLKGTLPPGRYVVYARATDGQGVAEAKFSRKLRNRYGFRVFASR